MVRPARTTAPRMAPLESQTNSNWRVDLRPLLLELFGLSGHARLRRGIVPDVLGDLHRAELWAAHRAEVRDLGAVGRKRLVMVRARGDRIERQVELIDPSELEARFAQRVVPFLRSRVT